MSALSEMDLALEQVRRAARREANSGYGMMVTTFMGLRPGQIQKLMDFYEENTGKHPSTIGTDAGVP